MRDKWYILTGKVESQFHFLILKFVLMYSNKNIATEDIIRIIEYYNYLYFLSFTIKKWLTLSSFYTSIWLKNSLLFYFVSK